jgi:hypothetical protein
MFVVRIVVGEKADFKVFEHLKYAMGDGFLCRPALSTR